MSFSIRKQLFIQDMNSQIVIIIPYNFKKLKLREFSLFDYYWGNLNYANPCIFVIVPLSRDLGILDPIRIFLHILLITAYFCFKFISFYLEHILAN